MSEQRYTDGQFDKVMATIEAHRSELIIRYKDVERLYLEIKEFEDKISAAMDKYEAGLDPNGIEASIHIEVVKP